MLRCFEVGRLVHWDGWLKRQDIRKGLVLKLILFRIQGVEVVNEDG